METLDQSTQILRKNLAQMDLALIDIYATPEHLQSMIIHGKETKPSKLSFLNERQEKLYSQNKPSFKLEDTFLTPIPDPNDII